MKRQNRRERTGKRREGRGRREEGGGKCEAVFLGDTWYIRGERASMSEVELAIRRETRTRREEYINLVGNRQAKTTVVRIGGEGWGRKLLDTFVNI